MSTRRRRGIRALETHYNGFRFRSRLEARWAVWLDTLGIGYRYEHQGFNLDGLNYLPDFWIPFAEPEPSPQGVPPTAGHYLEVKPDVLADDEERLLRLLAIGSRHTVLAFAGDPWPGEFAVYEFRRLHDDSAELKVWLPGDCFCCRGTGLSDSMPRFRWWRGSRIIDSGLNACDDCGGTGKVDPFQSLRSVLGLLGGPDSPAFSDCLQSAFAAARSARFEFGETPLPPGGRP
jgi:hypothetical protein